jgi:hypothetical protein
MAILKKPLLARVILLALSLALLFVSLASSRHIAPKAVKQLITLDHQVRRDLKKVERENLRSGVVIEEARAIIEPPQDGLIISPFPELFASYYTLSSQTKISIEPNSLILDLSPVLNL